MLSFQAPRTKRSTPGVIYAEFGLWSTGQLNMLCVESDFIASVSCNVAAKSVMVLENEKNATAKFSGRVTCFIQLVSLARPSLAIGHHVVYYCHYMYKVHIHRKLLPIPWSLLHKPSTTKQQPKQPALYKPV